MNYRVFVSDEWENNSFYVENRQQAELLFNMAVNSKMFSYVELAEIKENLITKREWVDEGVDTDGKC